MDTTGGYQSLLGLTSINSNSSTIDVLDVENININGVIDLSQAIVGGLTTSQVDEGLNLYYTDTRVNNNSNVSSNTTHRDRKDNPHAVTATQVGINSTDDIIEGVTNLYYTDIRFDDRLATKTTTSLAEGSNLYYTDARFDTRFGIKTTTNLTEGANLYYTDARFDTRFGIKTTTDLTEGTNLYYTTTRANADFDTRLATKTTTDLTEGTNLYYTTTRANADFDTRLATKTTDNLAEGTNLYYTDVRFDNRLLSKTTDNLTEGTNLYYTDARFDTRLATKTTTNLAEGTNLYYTDTRFDTRFGIKTTTDLAEGTNLYYTEARVSANTDVKANSDYRSVGHLPLSGGGITGDLDMNYNTIKNGYLIEIRENETTPVWTSDTTNEGIGWYLDTSNNDRLPVYLAFNNTYGPSADLNDAWFPQDTTGNYNINGTVNTASAPTTTLADTTVLYGEWIQIANTNRTMRMYSFILATRNHPWYSYPTDFTIIGSQDGASWYVVYETTGLTFSSQAEFKTIVTPPNGYYKYFRFIVQRVFNVIGDASGGYPRIGEWRPSFVYSGNLDSTLIEDVKANTAKVSADGSIDTHSDVSILEVQDQQFLKYSSFTQKWANVTPTTAMIAEHDNLYYTDARFDTRFATKTTTNLTEGTNLYYTEARFDTSFGVKKTTDLTEGINLYYTDARFDTRFGIKTTTNLTEGTNLYYTEARVSANTDVKANSDYRSVGHIERVEDLIPYLRIKGELITPPLYTTSNSEHAGWLLTRSTVYSSSYEAWHGLDGSTTTSWISVTGSYTTSGVYLGGIETKNVNGSTIINGEYWEIQYTGSPLYLSSFGVMNLNLGTYRAPPVLYSLVGSNDDGATWTIISRGTLGTGWTQGQTRQVLIEKPISAYTWFRFIAESSEPITGTDYVRVAEFIPVFEKSTWTEKKIVQIDDNNELLASNEVVGDLDITGDLSINGELNIGGEKITTGATNGLQLYGPSSDIGGPHIQAFVSTDNYPVFQQLNNSHGSIAMCFDAYADGFTWRSSSSGTNAIIYKSNTDLEFSYSSGVAAGGEVIWNAGFSMDLANGLVSFSNGVDVTGDLTISGTVDGVDVAALETAVSANTAKVSYPSADSTKVGFISVTQAVDLDVMESDIKTNSDYTAVGHLPLAGGTLTGDLTLGTVLNPDVWAVPIAPPTFTSNTSASPDWIITSSFNSSGWKSFNDDGDRWQSNGYDSGIYFSGTSPSTTYDGGSIVYGHYLQLKIPTGYRLNPEYQFRLNGQAYAPGQWYVLISDNGSTWTSWDYQTTQSWPGPYPEYRTFTGGPVVQTNYIRFVFTAQSFTGSVGGIVEVNWINLQVGFEDAGESMLAVNSTGLVSALSIRPPAGETLPLVMDDTGVVSLNSALIADVSANTAKISYPSADSTKVGYISVTQAVNLDTMESDIATKVSADGSINTHSDVNITTPADGHLLTYDTGEWKNLPPSGGTYVKIDGTSTLTGNLNMGSNRITSVATPTADTDGATKKYIDDKFEIYEEGKVFAERYSIATWANNTAEMDARFDGLTPNASQYLTNLYTMGWSGDYFGVIYNCYLYIPTDGNVTFRVRSDDSSDWFIDDALVASNYGGHAVGGDPLVTSTVFMTAGFHKSFSRVIEQTGGEGMIHDWDLNGGSTFTTIPTANILIPKLGLSDITDIGSGAIITTSERANIATNSAYVAVGHLPLAGGSMTGNINMGSNRITSVATPTTAGDAIPLAAHNTYVPTIGDGTNNFTLTSATGHYTVIGNMCHVSFYVLWTSKGSASGTIRLSLPFTSATGPYSSMALSAHNGIDASLPSIGCFNLSATNYVVFFDKPVGLFAMNQTSFTNAGAICGSGFFYL